MNRRIKDLRNALGLTQTAFASQINLSQNFIWLIEKGERIPSDRTLDDICRVYNVNRTWLETGEGEMFKPLKQQAEIEKLFKEVLAEPKDNGEQFRKALINAIARIPSDRWGDIADTFELIAMLYNDEKNGK